MDLVAVFIKLRIFKIC